MTDFINGCFEFCGALFITFSILKLYQEKQVRGVSWPHIAFFASWGVFNLYYYPALGQWWSFAGGVTIVTANSIWLGQLIYYTWKERRRL